MLQVLSTVLVPQHGTFTVGEFNSSSKPQLEELRKRLGVVPQHLRAMGGLTCFDFLSYVAWLRSVPAPIVAKRVRCVLMDVDLTDVADRRISTLSGGMRQRLSLAQGLINEPDLLLLDEPTVSLDPAQREQFLRLLSTMEGQRTIVMTSHVAEDVALFAEEVVVVLQGRVTFNGPVREFCGGPRDAGVTGFAVRDAYIAHIDAVTARETDA